MEIKDKDEINKSSSIDDLFDIIGNTKEKEADSECCQYDILTIEQIVQDITKCINDVNGFVNFPRITIRKLLNHFKWDKVELLQKYFDGNEEILFTEAKIINPYNKPIQNMRPDSENSETAECEVCSKLYPPNIMIELECGHRICTQCWSEYLTMKIMNDGHAQFIECPANSCDILIDDVTVINSITDFTVKMKYQRLITNNFVECNKLLRWCPSTDCSYAIKVSLVDDTFPVVCECNYRFCFACGENWHDPVKCQLLKNWIKMCNDEQWSINWIVENTKECPNCNTNIEKSGGCNIVQCMNENCKHEFCWLCRAPWSPYFPHECIQYNMEELGAAKNYPSKVELFLERYLQYYNRYMNHMQSLNFEKELCFKVKTKIESIQRKSIWNEAQVFTTAVDILFKCRQTLMYTYAFGYYLKKNNHSLIFEYNQNDLQTETEMLSGYLERDFTKEDFSVFSRIVRDKYIYCEKRRNILSEYIHEGYEKDFWDIEGHVITYK